VKILIATIGTRGDVQPFVALGIGLKAAGHDVTICTCPRFSDLISEHGIGFANLEEGLLELLDSDFGRAIFDKLNGVWGVIGTIPKVLKQVGPIHRRMVDDCWSAVERSDPDLIVFNPKMFCVPAFAAVRGIPAVLAMLQPLHVPTRDRPVFGRSLGRFYNRGTYRFVHRLTKFGTRGYMRAWRAKYDVSGHSKNSGPTQTSAGNPIPVIHAFSKFVVPRPVDWPEHASIAGYWFMPPESSHAKWSPSQDLLEFLEAGPPPIYFGFGSMAGVDPSKVTQTILSAVQGANRRAILATGWGGVDPDMCVGEGIHVLESAPHQWLFPKVSAVVHHGGAGTTAAGLRAGCPTVVCPFGLDQPFWGNRIVELGAGVSPISQRKLTASNLAAALESVTTVPSFRSSAKAIAASIQAEDGITNAIQTIEQVHKSHQHQRVG